MGPWTAAARSAGRWDRNIKLFFAANFLFQAGSGMFSVLYNLYVQALGYDPVMNGRLISAASFATALMFIPIGLAGDRYGSKRPLLAGIAGSGMVCLGRSFAETPLTLQLFALLSGLFMAGIQVLAVPFLADYARRDERLRILSLHFSATLAAQVLGSTFGGLLADLLHGAGMSRIAGLQIALAVGSAGMWAAAVPLLGIRERTKDMEPAPEKAGTSADAETGTAVEASAAGVWTEADGGVDAPGVRTEADSGVDASVVQATDDTVANEDARAATPISGCVPNAAAIRAEDRRVIAGLAFTQFLTGIGSGLVIPYLNLYFTDRFNVSLTAVGILISLGQVMTIVSMLMGPRLVRRVGQVKAILTFQLLSLPFLILTGFTHLLGVATVGYLFRQALMNAANPIHSSILVDRVSPARRGTANSINQTLFMLAWALTGLVQPVILARYGTYWGYAATFCMTGVLYSASAACFYRWFREKRKTQSDLAKHAKAAGLL